MREIVYAKGLEVRIKELSKEYKMLDDAFSGYEWRLSRDPERGSVEHDGHNIVKFKFYTSNIRLLYKIHPGKIDIIDFDLL